MTVRSYSLRLAENVAGGATFTRLASPSRAKLPALQAAKAGIRKPRQKGSFDARHQEFSKQIVSPQGNRPARREAGCHETGCEVRRKAIRDEARRQGHRE
jgi:hypothetical protein